MTPLEKHLADAARHHRQAMGWSGLLIGLSIAVLLLLLARGLWPPAESQIPQPINVVAPQG